MIFGERMFNLDDEHPQDDLKPILDNILAEDRDIKISTLYRLSDMPASDFERFSTAWPTLSVQRRQTLARHLADISEENFQVDFYPLFHFMLADPSPEVRTAALAGLWDCDRVDLIAPILHLMEQDESEIVRTAAAANLGHYVMLIEWGQLAERHLEPIVSGLLAQWDAHPDNLLMRSAVLESISPTNHTRIPHMIEAAYGSYDGRMRKSALFAMGRSADKRWVQTVKAELENSDVAMRAEAARAAGMLGSGELLEVLIEMVEFDDDIEVRLAAVQALGQIGGDEAMRALSRMAENEEDDELLDALDKAQEMSAMWGDLDFDLLDIDFNEDDEDRDPLG